MTLFKKLFIVASFAANLWVATAVFDFPIYFNAIAGFILGFCVMWWLEE